MQIFGKILIFIALCVLGLLCPATKNIALLLLLLFVFVGFIVYFYMIASGFFHGLGQYATFVPAVGKGRKDTIALASDILRKSKKKLRIADLGAGNGALLIPLAKAFPQHQFTGYEWDFLAYWWGRWRIRKIPNLTFYRQDYFKADLSQTNMIVSYIGIGKREKADLGKKLMRELPHQAWVINLTYPMHYLPLVKIVPTQICHVPTRIFVYHLIKK